MAAGEKRNLLSNRVDEIIGEYYAAKGYSVQSVDRQGNGQLIVVTERVAEEKEPAKVDITFDFIHRRRHKKKYLA
ncbi:MULTISPECIES: hypothetical protein [Bacillus amyloliquefaciens group]|jgi:hypothetical protein|uniref:hypothetical protein n=1 Tax=Bacillus amyloliquefaciens group TaxID=1938374 RepID=UPI001580F973|nr:MULTISPECIES: hypothetical protein [Bacillus amyloliquefaciens group]NUI22281.1 hypothetical protein [Bacillus amyloliquefaciens]NUI31269.1 hypothetical protein [Bacillus amyloliquefaciens]NUI35178.1 hypothetical protein [Bacillus amyloliquefaciens]NUI69026.1 hypothetical protein [Bacillus amyloliquefaciens]NUI74429.1 hypothetical protein [Bacillus amyloliquefaciens]